jgi:hypothetical protein
MNGDNHIRIVVSYNYPDPFSFDLANIAPVASCIPLFSQRAAHHELRVRLSQSCFPQFVLRVPREVHALPKGAHGNFSPPLGTQNADTELAAVDLGSGTVGAAVVGDGGG